MVETLRDLIGIQSNELDFIIIILCCVLIMFCFKYTLDLFAYLFGWVGGKNG